MFQCVFFSEAGDPCGPYCCSYHILWRGTLQEVGGLLSAGTQWQELAFKEIANPQSHTNKYTLCIIWDIITVEMSEEKFSAEK